MKRLLMVLAFVSSCAAAAPQLYSFQFNEVRFPDLLRVVYSEVLDRSYVIESDALGNSDVLTMHIKGKTAAEVEAYVSALLDARGFSVVRRGAVDVIGKKQDLSEVDKEVFVYRPLFRSVSYLNDLIAGFFPKGSFSGQRQIAAPVTQVQGRQQMGGVVPGQANNQGQGQGQMQGLPVPQDSGTSAYSQIDKGQQDTIVFQGDERNIKRLEKLLAQLDKPSGELIVKAVVYEVRTDEKEANAMKIAAGLLNSKFGLDVDTGEIAQNAIKLKFGDFNAIYSALSTDSRFKLVSAPVMRVRSGSNARFVAGADVPVLGNVTYPQGGQAVQSIEYKQSGVILDISPIVRESSTDLNISQQISSFVTTTTGVNQSPTLLKREIQTNVSFKDGDIVVLGGLEEKIDSGEVNGLSFLPDWMKAKSDGKQRTEIMIVLDVQRI